MIGTMPDQNTGKATPSAMTQWLTAHKRRLLKRAVNAAAASVEWLAGLLGREPVKMTEDVRFTAPSPVLFLPYLSGERTPHNDAFARGAFVGLDQTSDPNQLTQAVLEGVAFAFRDCLDVLGSAGAEITRAVAVGGGSKSVTWLRIIANVLGITIDVPADGDFGAAFGAARLSRA